MAPHGPISRALQSYDHVFILWLGGLSGNFLGQLQGCLHEIFDQEIMKFKSVL